MKRIAIFAAALAFATSAYAMCSTHTVIQGGRMVTCTTCCVGNSCTTTCM